MRTARVNECGHPERRHHTHGMCAACRSKEYHAENREKRNAEARARSSARYHANREVLRAKNRAYHVAHPEKARELKLRRYGITPAQYDAMFAAQGGCCAICRRARLIGRGAKLHVDHCHASRRVRGLLCVTCNATVGHLEGDPAPIAVKLERLCEYLTKCDAIREAA